VLTSIDGTNWEANEPENIERLEGITYGNGSFVGVGLNNLLGGAAITSIDGTNWSAHNINPAFRPAGIAYGNNVFVAVGDGPTFSSADGLTWTNRSPSAMGYLYGVAFGNGTFVAVGNNKILRSSDGLTWTPGPGGYSLMGITYGAGTFMAVGSPGTVITSPDGITWTSQSSGTDLMLLGVAYGREFISVGANGIILQSRPARSALEAPRITGALGTSGFELIISGTAGATCVVQYAPELGDSGSWQTLTTLKLTNAPTAWVDTSALGTARRFYRATASP